MATEQFNGQDSLSDLRKVDWRPNLPLHQYKGFWVMPILYESIQTIHSQFKPQPSDVIIASFPKTGTTWLKALTVSIPNHKSMPQNNDPLLTHNPHELVPMLELELFNPQNPKTNPIENMPSPRLYNTHLPLSLLPQSIMDKTCRIIYVARNPMDTIVSCWHFFNKMFGGDISLEQSYDEFCEGTTPSGPFFEHVLEYWKVREKGNVFFVTYEELKQDTKKHVKRLGEFLGCDDLDENEISEIMWRSSINRLRKLEVNGKNSEKKHFTGTEFEAFFRKGVVGDYHNHLTPNMVQGLNSMIQQKWQGSGLEFKFKHA